MPAGVEYETGPVLRINSDGLRRQNGTPGLGCGRQPDLAPAAMDATAFLHYLCRCRDRMKMER